MEVPVQNFITLEENGDHASLSAMVGNEVTGFITRISLPQAPCVRLRFLGSDRRRTRSAELI